MRRSNPLNWLPILSRVMRCGHMHTSGWLHHLGLHWSQAITKTLSMHGSTPFTCQLSICHTRISPEWLTEHLIMIRPSSSLRVALPHATWYPCRPLSSHASRVGDNPWSRAPSAGDNTTPRSRGSFLDRKDLRSERVSPSKVSPRSVHRAGMSTHPAAAKSPI